MKQQQIRKAGSSLKKFGLLACLFSFSTQLESSLVSEGYDYEPMDFTYAKLNYGYKYDVGYRTTYESGKDDEYGMDGWQKEEVGFQIYSLMAAEMLFDALGVYKFGMKVQLAPAEITPYKQIVKYVRPDDLYIYKEDDVTENGFDVYIKGAYSLRLMRLTFHFTHHWMRIKKSFLNWIFKDASIIPVDADDLEFVDDYKQTYEDEYWTFEIGSILDFFDVEKKYEHLYGEDITIWDMYALNNYITEESITDE